MLQLALSIFLACVLFSIGIWLLALCLVHWGAIATVIGAAVLIGVVVGAISADPVGAALLATMALVTVGIGYALTEGAPRLWRRWRERKQELDV